MLHHLGQTCRAAREAADLRQLDIATAAATTHATISRFETGRAWPLDPDRVVEAYALELGVAPLALWSDAVSQWRESASSES